MLFRSRLTQWNIVCRPKDQGGLGVEVLELKNKCLLSKWLFKLLHEEGVWQELLRNKYLGAKTLAHVEARPTDSHSGRVLWELKMSSLIEVFLRLVTVAQLGSGRTRS